MLSHPKACVFVIAAEPSGDLLGRHIIRGLSKRFPTLSYRGVGGALMESAGHFSSIIPLSQLSCMGLVSIVKKLPFLVKCLSKVRRCIQQVRPMALVTIDAPDFSLRISQNMRDIPRIHCVAPSVWAWRPGRAKALAQKTDHLLTLFPFEAKYFRHMDTTYVGHPSAETPLGCADRFWSQYYEKSPMICLLPGSRKSEVDRCLPIFLEAAKQISMHKPGVKIVLVCPLSLRDYISKRCPGIKIFSDESEKRDVFAATTLAITASGTVTLELARQGVSMIVGHRLSSLSAWIAQRMVKIPHVCLLNILSEYPFVPEYLQENLSPEALCRHAMTFLDSPCTRHAQILQSQKVLDSIQGYPHSFATNVTNAIDSVVSKFYA